MIVKSTFNDPSIFLLLSIWFVFLTFNIFAIPALSNEYPMGVDYENVSFHSLIFILGTFCTFYISKTLFPKNLRAHRIAAISFMGSPFVLIFSVLPLYPFLILLINNWLFLIATICIFPCLIWPLFWKSIYAHCLRSKFNFIVVISTMLWITCSLVFLIQSNLSEPIYFLPIVSILSILIGKLFANNTSKDAIGDERPIYTIMLLLTVIQFFPMIPNYWGLEDTEFQINVDYSKSNGFFFISSMGVLLSFIFLKRFFKSEVKANLIWFSAGTMITLSLMSHQTQKHSDYYNQPSVVVHERKQSEQPEEIINHDILARNSIAYQKSGREEKRHEH